MSDRSMRWQIRRADPILAAKVRAAKKAKKEWWKAERLRAHAVWAFKILPNDRQLQLVRVTEANAQSKWEAKKAADEALGVRL